MAVNSGVIDPNLLTDPNNPTGAGGQMTGTQQPPTKAPTKKAQIGGLGSTVQTAANVQPDDAWGGHKLGASLFEVNPILGLAATLIGGSYDYATAGDRAQKQVEGAANRTAEWTKMNNVYGGDGYMQQGQPNLAWHTPEAEAFGYGGAVKKKTGYADGGAVGHVIPAENAGKVIADGKKAGVDLTKPMQQSGEQVGGTVPGNGGPKADDKQVKPAGSAPINVSSGEVFVSDDLMSRLAKIAGLDASDYGQSLYPNADGGKNMADGGPVDGDPKKPPVGNINTTLMNPAAADMQWDARNPMIMEPRVDISPLALRDDQKNPVLKSSTIASGNDADTVAGNKAYDDMQKWNRQSAVIQGVGQIGSLAYNIFSKRTPGTPPANFTPEKLDLKTGAYRAKLDSDRARGTATALYNTKDKQGLGRDLGIIANDLSSRLDISAKVEGVENQERVANTQSANQAGLFNTQQRNAYQQAEAATANQFRAMKGQAVSRSLGELAGVTSDYLNNKISIEDRRNMNKYQEDYLNYLGGAKGFENMSPADFYKNYQPQLQATQASTAP